MKKETSCGLVLVNNKGLVERVTWTENSGPLAGTDTLRISRCRESDGSGEFFMAYAYNAESRSGITRTGKKLSEALPDMGEMGEKIVSLFDTENPAADTLKSLGLKDYEIKQGST